MQPNMADAMLTASLNCRRGAVLKSVGSGALALTHPGDSEGDATLEDRNPARSPKLSFGQSIASLQARSRIFAQAAAIDKIKLFGDVNLMSKVVGYLDHCSLSGFKLASKFTFNAAQRVAILYLEKLERLSPDARLQMMNGLLKNHDFHSPEMQGLLALPEGVAAMRELRNAYQAYVNSGNEAPHFAHWCLDFSVEIESPRPLQLLLASPNTNVNASYADEYGEKTTLLYRLALYHDQVGKSAVVDQLTDALLGDTSIDVNRCSSSAGLKDSALFGTMYGPNLTVFNKLGRHPKLNWNAADVLGATVLHDAASAPYDKGRLQVLRPHLSRMNVNAQDIDGNTALHVAVIHDVESAEKFELLIEAGIDQTIQNGDSNTAFQEAIIRNNTVALQVLTPQH
jgi:hypothetical protein